MSSTTPGRDLYSRRVLDRSTGQTKPKISLHLSFLNICVISTLLWELWLAWDCACVVYLFIFSCFFSISFCYYCSLSTRSVLNPPIFPWSPISFPLFSFCFCPFHPNLAHGVNSGRCVIVLKVGSSSLGFPFFAVSMIDGCWVWQRGRA